MVSLPNVSVWCDEVVKMSFILQREGSYRQKCNKTVTVSDY